MRNLLLIAALVVIVVLYLRSKNKPAAAAPAPTYTLPDTNVTLPLVQGNFTPVVYHNPFAS